MAVQLVGTPTNVTDGGSYTAEAGSNRLVVAVALAESASNRTWTAWTWGGTAGHFVVRDGGTNGGVENVEFWYWLESEIQAGAQVSDPTPSGTVNGPIYRFFTFTGVDQTNPIEDSGTAEAASGESGSITGGLDTSSMIVAAHIRSGSTTNEAWTSPLTTETNAASGSTFDYTTATGTGTGTATPVEMSWTTSRNWALAAIALKASADSGALSGSSSLTFTPSGSLVGSAALSGSSALSFAPTASLVGTAAISGASSLTFATSGAIEGAASLSGASSITFAPTADLLGAAALSGASTLTFSISGNLDVGAADLSGSTSLSFTTSGALLGTASLSGATDLTFALSADLSLAGGETEPVGGHYWPTPKRKKRKSRLDEQTADRAELRQAIEQAARPIVEQAVEAAPAPEVPATAPARKPRRATPAPRIDIEAIAARAARIALDERKAELSKRAHAAVLALLEDMAVGIIEELVEDEMRDA